VWDTVEDVEESFEDETTTQGKLDFDLMQS
jgi:hypothetical protein